MSWGKGRQAGVQQGELAEEAAQVLGSGCHRDQCQQDLFVINNGGDLDRRGRRAWGLLHQCHAKAQPSRSLDQTFMLVPKVKASRHVIMQL